MTVYYLLRKEVYSKPELMKNLTAIKRYIDDGAGTFKGSKREFKLWLQSVNRALDQYGLLIDESSVEDPGDFVAFLDIQFCFDAQGELQTDLFVKETDSRSYLSFGSSHPNHIFSGIVYSQCLRLRRIINCSSRLKVRLADLKNSFIKAKYPSLMVESIIKKVSSKERNLYEQKPKKEPDSSIRVVTTYGSDSDIIASVKKAVPHLSRTRSFSCSDNDSTFVGNPQRNVPDLLPDTKPNKLFSFVKKTGSSLRNKLVKAKNLALGQKYGITKPCRNHGN